MSAFCRDQCKCNSCRPASHNSNVFLFLSRCKGFRKTFLESGSRIDCTLRMPSQNKLINAAFLTADTRPDLLHIAGKRLVAPVRICKQWSGKHHHVAVTIPNRFFCDIRIPQFSDCNNRNVHSSIRFDTISAEEFFCDLGHIKETSRRHSLRWMRQPPVVIAAQIHIKQIHSCTDQFRHIMQGILDRSSIFKPLQTADFIHPILIGLIQCQRQVDPVHDREGISRSLSNLTDDIQPKHFIIFIMSHLSSVECRICHLFQQISFMPMQIDTV